MYHACIVRANSHSREREVPVSCLLILSGVETLKSFLLKGFS